MTNPHSSGIDQVLVPFIDGAPSTSKCDREVEIINPSNGRRCLVIPAGCAEDADLAVGAARRAHEDGRWGDLPPSRKKKILHGLVDLVASHSREFDALDAIEMGKPVGEVFGSASAAAALMRFYAEAVDKVTGDVYASDEHSFVTQRRVPRGVVAAIVPWNFPTYVAVLKLAPALAAGNCVVLKPSELSSRSAVRLAVLAMEAGIPAGVVNVVLGLGETVGRALGLHSNVDMITFTGSTEVGKRLLQYAGQSNLKAVMLECGGKSPQIVFADGVDLDAAADSIAGFMLTNQGQICNVGSRLLVQRSIEDAVVAKIVQRFRRIVIGDALDPRTTFGPVASAGQLARVMEYITGARRDGMQLASGGARTLEETGGYFVQPTVLCEVPPSSRVAREEIFGPVLTVIPFDEESDAIRIANDTMYGLAAYVWTTNLSTGLRVMKAIRSSVRINATSPAGEGAGHAASSEPAGQSGIGTEGGLAGMESYMRRQRVSFSHA